MAVDRISQDCIPGRRCHGKGRYFIARPRWIRYISIDFANVLDFGAVPDTWPWEMPSNTFNAGVLSLTPSNDTYAALLEQAMVRPMPWDAEQGLLNDFFLASTPNNVYPPQYTRTTLPMKYNLNLAALNNHPIQWNDTWPDARIVHFTISKPSSKECKPSKNCLYPQPLNAWRDEFLEMKEKYRWAELETAY